MALRQVFPSDITEKLRFFYFAQDDERTPAGEVVPGVSGIVYECLGFNGQAVKSSYVPHIVEQRRSRILRRRKARAS